MGQDTQEFPGAWDPWDVQQGQVWIKTVQGDAKKHKEREQMCPYQPPNDAEKNQKAQEPTIHEQGAGNSGNPKRRTVKGSGWETFNLTGMNQLTRKK